MARGRHRQCGIAEERQAVRDVGGTAAVLAPHLGNEECHVQDVNLVRQDMGFELVGKNQNRVVGHGAANQGGLPAAHFLHHSHTRLWLNRLFYRKRMSSALSNVEPGSMSKPPGLSKLLILLGAISILTPFSLDMYLPALPAIAQDLHSNANAVELTLPSFFAGLAVEPAAVRLPRRPPRPAAAAALRARPLGDRVRGCALSAGIASLTVWRVVQALGVGSASVIPRAVIRDRFDVSQTARALSLLGLITGLGPILAPQLGGAILLVRRLARGILAVGGPRHRLLSIAFFTLRESIPAQRASVIGPKLWLKLLTDRRYLSYALPANLMQSGVFAYIAGAPFVYIDHFKLSPQQFAWMFGANAMGLHDRRAHQRPHRAAVRTGADFPPRDALHRGRGSRCSLRGLRRYRRLLGSRDSAAPVRRAARVQFLQRLCARTGPLRKLRRDRLGAVRHAAIRVRRLGRGGGERALRWDPPCHGGRHVRHGRGCSATVPLDPVTPRGGS